jgi:hypothetical protein
MPEAGTVSTTERPSGESRRRWLTADWWEGSRFGQVFGADVRSLAAFRIAIALIVLMDMVARWPNIRIHLTDEGVLPRSMAVESFVRWRWSINLTNDLYEFQAALVLLTMAAAASMLVGYRTRLMTVLVWVLVVSIQVRNPYVLSGADSLLRVLLFWAMFLPLGAVWSIDQRRTPRVGRPAHLVLSFATIGLFLQIAFMYWFTAALKSAPEWRSEGTALYYALGAGHITKPFGEYLHQFPELLRVMTHASLGLEIVAPILLFCPFLTGPVRTFAVASIMVFHLGIYLTMDVGIFPWTSALCMLGFLPAWFWDHLLPAVRERVPVRGDRLSREWQSLVQGVRRQWEPVRERLGHQRLMFSTAGMTPDTYPPAAAAAAKVSPGVAAQTVDPPAVVVTTQRAGPVANVFMAVCIVFVFLWNLTSVTAFTMPRETLPFAYSSGLYQQWNMFAPHPSKSTSWIVVRGVLRDGREIDLLTPIVQDDLTRVPALTWDRPDNIVGEYYGDKYWRKYLTALGTENRSDERRAFAAYSCRTWNGYYGGDVRLAGLQIVRMSQPTLPDDEEASLRRSVVAQFRCG